MKIGKKKKSKIKNVGNNVTLRMTEALYDTLTFDECVTINVGVLF